MLCAACGLELRSDQVAAAGLCPHHAADSSWDDDWAANNRLMCDFIHRSATLPRAERAIPIGETADGEILLTIV